MNKTSSAFTLIELLIVIFIISLTAALVMPNLWTFGDQSLKSDAKRIGNTLRYVYDEAAGKKRTYILEIDLNTGSWGFKSERESRNFRMKENVIIEDIIVPSLGQVSIGQVTLKFGPLGPEEPITIHLRNDDSEYTVMFNHISGRTKIYKGRIQDEL